MTVNPVNSGTNYVSQVQPQPQTQAERVVEQEKLRNREDINKPEAANAPPPPTVNTSGQQVGAIINVQA
jgi:transcription initiation factor TFIID subunit TAF12